jgi:hypothetical protein
MNEFRDGEHTACCTYVRLKASAPFASRRKNGAAIDESWNG